MSTRFAFVSWTHESNHTATDRTQIRSHCMKGRNKRVGSRRSVREARQAARQASQSRSRSSQNEVVDHYVEMEDGLCSTPSSLTQALQQWRVMTQPQKSPLPPLDPAITRFALRVNKPAHEILHQVLSFTELSNGSFMYIAEICVDFDLYKVSRSSWPLHDEALLSTVLLSTSALRDYALQQSPTTTTRFHLVRTLSLLNDKLSDKRTCILDSTIFLTVCLAVMAGIFGDTAAAGAHLSGLQKIVTLRGGTTYFRQHPKLQHKLESLDLLCCLAFDCKPRFLGSPIDWNVPCLPCPSKPISNVTELENSLEAFDSRLLATFYDLRQLASLVNEHNERRSRLSADIFQPALSSIQTRLLHLGGVLKDTASEWFCLGMLTFIAAMFRPPGPKLEYAHLTQRLRLSGQRIDVKLPKLRILVFWFLVVSGTVIFDHDEPWLCTVWSEVVEAGMSWDEAREYLQRVVWIGCIQDEVGKRTFTTINSRIHPSP